MECSALAVGAAISKPGRRVMFWGRRVPLLPFAVVGVLGWWTIAFVALAAVLAGAGVLFMRRLTRHALVVAPPSLRAALPAPRPVRAVVLPRNLAITRARRALPAPAKALPAARMKCGKCGRPIARSASSGLWWAVDGLPVTAAAACAHEPAKALPAPETVVTVARRNRRRDSQDRRTP